MKKLTLSIIAAVVSHVCFAAAPVDLGASANYTPYDRYLSPVKQVLSHLDGQPASMDKVRQLMVEGRNFRYSFTTPYVAALPDVTASTHAGDCKAKALWLASQLNDPNVRFVIGRARDNSTMSHAWLMWKSEGKWWILDCTLSYKPIEADTINPERQYIPLYSYSKSGSYRHHATNVAAVASSNGTLVASSK
ncbi:MAG TPA: hypothetical protein VG733_16545 [Chthoniobacteraceae bacterium]|nr:hypothetical protein [Chthoniobacteraceae bacterium]